MGDVTLAAGASGTDIVLGEDQVFKVEHGKVDFSTDAGTTWQPRVGGENIVFSSGLTVSQRNSRPELASRFTHMPI
jgi:hypothetical protein